MNHFVIIGEITLIAPKNSILRTSVNNSERNCAHVSTFQTFVAQKIPKWRIFLCTRNKIQKLFPYELNLFFLEKFDI